MALVHRREVFEPLYAVRLETPLVLVELGAGDAAPPTSLGDVPQGLGQLKHREPSPGQFRFCFHALLGLLPCSATEQGSEKDTKEFFNTLGRLWYIAASARQLEP